VGDGSYVLGGLAVDVVEGCARLVGGGAIAGSTLTLDTALGIVVNDSGIAVECAVHALTAAPAKALGRDGDLGSLQVGFVADAVLLDQSLTVTASWGAGRRLV